jgi:hypothetical protein
MLGSRNENIIIEENDENTVEVKRTEFLLKYYYFFYIKLI